MAKTKKISNSIKAKPKNEIKMLQKLIKNAVKTFEVKIKELEQMFINQTKDHQIKVNQEEVYGVSTSNINDQRQNIVYNIHNVTIEKPKFGNGNTHSVTFLKDFTNYLKKVPSNGLEISITQECLVGEAKYWARINSVRWTTIDDFKADFLRVFWGEEEQNKVKRFLVQNKWSRHTHPNMVSYFLYVIEKAQKLSCPIPEKP